MIFGVCMCSRVITSRISASVRLCLSDVVPRMCERENSQSYDIYSLWT